MGGWVKVGVSPEGTCHGGVHPFVGVGPPSPVGAWRWAFGCRGPLGEGVSPGPDSGSISIPWGDCASSLELGGHACGVSPPSMWVCPAGEVLGGGWGGPASLVVLEVRPATRASNMSMRVEGMGCEVLLRIL